MILHGTTEETRLKYSFAWSWEKEFHYNVEKKYSHDDKLYEAGT